ncbi:MAG: hypothetical protein ACRECT_00190 [Thermoplasmata archaeon]
MLGGVPSARAAAADPPGGAEVETADGGGSPRLMFVGRITGDRVEENWGKKQESPDALATRSLRSGRPQLESMRRSTDAGSSGSEQTVPAGVQGEIARNGTRNPSWPVEDIGGGTGSQ